MGNWEPLLIVVVLALIVAGRLLAAALAKALESTLGRRDDEDETERGMCGGQGRGE